MRRALILCALLAGCDEDYFPRLECGPGTELEDDTCVPRAPDCGPGTRLEQGRCVVEPSAEVSCAVGTRREGLECVPDPLGEAASATTSWSRNVRVSEPSYEIAAEPAMSVDSQGRIYIASIVLERYDPMEFRSSVALWRSTDGGTSFETLLVVDPPAGRYLGDVTLIHDRADRLYFAWIQYAVDENLGDVIVLRSNDGASFGEPELVDPEGQGNFRDRPWFAPAPGGKIALSWVSLIEFAGASANVAFSVDGGSFGAPEVFGTTEPGLLNTPIAWNDQGVAVGAFGRSSGVTAWVRRDDAWAPARPVELGPQRLQEIQPVITWTPRAGFTIAFLGPPEHASALYTVHSLDARSWSVPSRIDSGFPTGASAALVWSTTDERGRVHLMWLDNRSGGWVPYTAYSLDGVHFVGLERIGDTPFVEDYDFRRWIGDFNAIVVKNGVRYATWTDTRDGRSAIYFSRASAPEAP
jgi:hypothetical protein